MVSVSVSSSLKVSDLNYTPTRCLKRMANTQTLNGSGVDKATMAEACWRG
jgi:hypothetical protein